MTETLHRVLCADPPWAYRDALPGRGRGAKKHYKLLGVRELEAFPVPPMADDALLFLWRVTAMPEEAFRVCRAWGFTPKSEIVWVKRTARGNRHFGMGRYVRMEHENCVIAARGRGSSLILRHNVRSVFEAPVGTHSTKPDAFYDMVESLAEGPYAELFARRRRVGWNQWGDELPQEAA